MNDVPFYANRPDNMSCMLASIRSALESFTGRTYSWEEMEDLLGFQPNKAAWTVKIWKYLATHGFDIRMIEPFDYRKYQAEGKVYLETYFEPEELAWQLKHTNLLEIKSFLPTFLETIHQEVRSPQLADIDAMLADEYLVTVQLNSNTLNGKKGYAAHMILVYAKDGDDYITHDPGLPPHESRRIPSALLLDAMGGIHNTTEVTGLKLRDNESNLETSRAQRLDQKVVELMPVLSRAFATKLIEQGKVKVNNAVVTKASLKVKPGQQFAVDYDIAEIGRIPDIDLPVLYEDDNCVVINKPAGVLTHSKGAFNPEATVATWLRTRQNEEWRMRNGEMQTHSSFSVPHSQSDRTGIVHRLDRATSGVMICAKTPEALSWLQKQFSQRKVKKTYMAIVAGRLEPEHAVIDMPIERNPKAPATFRVGANGKSATTEYNVEKTSARYILVKLTPTTGRTHQLRVHLKQVGHPIVGDTLYDGEDAERLFLHALSLEITLPNHERKVFTTPLPKEFEHKLEVNRG